MSIEKFFSNIGYKKRMIIMNFYYLVKKREGEINFFLSLFFLGCEFFSSIAFYENFLCGIIIDKNN